MQFHTKIAISAFFRKIKEVSYLVFLNKEHMMLVRDEPRPHHSYDLPDTND